jgi:alpha-L-fucosidase 2
MNGLVSDHLSSRWDEAIPLGNGMLGALIWQKDKNLRFSLDRADLWDLRPMENQNTPEWKFKWVHQQWENDAYHKVQEKFDEPYLQNPAPSKIPGGALEFVIDALGKVKEVRLNLKDALCALHWENGARLDVFVHATEPFGCYFFEGVPEDFEPRLIVPSYQKNLDSEDFLEADDQSRSDLYQLGYPEGLIALTEDSITYDQEGWGDFRYQIYTQWQRDGHKLLGFWSISSQYPSWEEKISAKQVVESVFETGFDLAYQSHTNWWHNFWAKSSIEIPDKLLEKQWYLEIYKFGSVARQGAPPISLQSVWTADNGKLPPWKGDYHHDLNTQLSYWPAYSANHLDLEQGFIDWLWKCKPTFEKYTRNYFDVSGLNVPGVTTLSGEPMGGWAQYSFGLTISAWLGQHFYWHWRFSMDQDFLRDKAYPWIKSVATFLSEIALWDEKTGLRKLPLSSSPEIFNNSREAWFETTTNFDLALIRWTYEKAAELATELGFDAEAAGWNDILSQWPEYAIDDQTGFMLAPGMPHNESHRHLSHLMAFHPLGLIDFSQGQQSQAIIQNSVCNLEEQGYSEWNGYSFSWLGNLYARVFDGEKAAKALRIFAERFCTANSFHVNVDQTSKKNGEAAARPFTLEGNFAFAAGIQEMLIQSHTGIVRLFPAIPKAWENVKFDQLRTERAFLVSAERKAGHVIRVEIFSEKCGTVKLANPFSTQELNFVGSGKYQITNGIIELHAKTQDRFVIEAQK